MSDGAVEADKRWNPLRGLYNWVMGHAEGPYALWLLAAISFAESSFFPMPPDVLMIPMIMVHREKAFKLAAWTAMWSVIGGMLGYAIGSLLYHTVGMWLIKVYGMGPDIETFRTAFKTHGALIVLQGLTPVPYKIVSIASGVAGLSFPLFIVLSTITRSFRFLIVGALLYWFGDPVRVFLEKYLGWVVLIVLLVIIAGYWGARHLFS
jgi:membrane protein YqaA with SNARE-associated domain